MLTENRVDFCPQEEPVRNKRAIFKIIPANDNQVTVKMQMAICYIPNYVGFLAKKKVRKLL